MSITIDLAPETEAKLRDKAAIYGQDLPTYLRDLAERDAAEADDALTAEDVAAIRAGIRRGMEAFDQGRYRALEEVIAEKRDRYGLDI